MAVDGLELVPRSFDYFAAIERYVVSVAAYFAHKALRAPEAHALAAIEGRRRRRGLLLGLLAHVGDAVQHARRGV